MPSTSENTAVDRPMPNARVRKATSANAGECRRLRPAIRQSWAKVPSAHAPRTRSWLVETMRFFRVPVRRTSGEKRELTPLVLCTAEPRT